MQTIPLKSSGTVIVDDHWFDYLNQWGTWRLVNGSVCRSEMVNGKQTFIHMRRVVMKPQGKEIILHRNKNPLDCQEHNLEVTTRRDLYRERFNGGGFFDGDS